MADEKQLSTRTRQKLKAELDEAAGQKGTSDELPDPPIARRTGGLAERRGLIAATLVAAIVVGGIVSLALASWWFLVLALGLHALGSLTVLLLAAGALSESEHASAGLAEDLRAEGVAAPDRLLTDLADERRGEYPG